MKMTAFGWVVLSEKLYVSAVVETKNWKPWLSRVGAVCAWVVLTDNDSAESKITQITTIEINLLFILDYHLLRLIRSITRTFMTVPRLLNLYSFPSRAFRWWAGVGSFELLVSFP